MEKFWSKRSHGIVCPSSVHFATYTGTLLTVIKRIQSPPVAHKDSSSSFSLWYHCQPPPSLACVRPFEPSGPWIPMRTPRVLLPPTFSVLGMVWSFRQRERSGGISPYCREKSRPQGARTASPPSPFAKDHPLLQGLIYLFFGSSIIYLQQYTRTPHRP